MNDGPSDDATHRHYQRQLDTRAIELATRAMQAAEQASKMFGEHIELIRLDLREMKADRARMHDSNETKINSIQRAMWGCAVSSILILAGWVFYLVTHQH